MEDGHPLRELRLGVPAAQDVQQAGEEAALEEAHEEAEHVQLGDVAQPGLAERERAPRDLHAGEEQARPDALDDERRGDLHDGVGAGVGGPRVGVLVAVHGQVLLHARHVGVGEVALVEVLEEEAQAADGEDGEVELAEEDALRGALEVRVRVPDEGAEGLLRGRRDLRSRRGHAGRSAQAWRPVRDRIQEGLAGWGGAYVLKDHSWELSQSVV